MTEMLYLRGNFTRCVCELPYFDMSVNQKYLVGLPLL